MIEIEELKRFLAKWHDDPTLMVRQLFKSEPDRGQLEVLQSVTEEDRIAIRSGHGVGKTTVLAWIAWWWFLTRFPAKIPVTAPTSHQLLNVFWSELMSCYGKMPLFLRDMITITISQNSTKVTWKDNPLTSFIVARTARKETPEAFQGFHGENILLIADEASGIDDSIFEVAEGALTTEGAKMIIAGNPTRISGYFYNAFHRNKKLFKNIRIAGLDAKFVTEKYRQSIRDNYGEDSNVYRIRVLGEFPRSDEDSLIELGWVEDAISRDIESNQHKVYWGLDVAMVGDECALAKRKGNILLERVKTWREKDLMATAARVVNEYRNTDKSERPEYIFVDSIGIGAGVASRLKEEGLPAIAVNVAEKPPSIEKYRRLKDELWFRVREWFSERNCKIQEDEMLITDLSTIKFSLLADGKLAVESKTDLKSRLGRSPDRGDAFALTFTRPDVMDTPVERYQRKQHSAPPNWKCA